MELETAERRIEELNKLVQDLEEKVAVAQADKDREMKLKETAEQLKEDLEHSLERESERAEEFKVILRLNGWKTNRKYFFFFHSFKVQAE